jgi:hypothetical protein
MVGPVLSALMRHLATSAAVENANAVHEPIETFGSFETFGMEAHGPSGWEGSVSSMPTPVMRNLAPSSLAWQLELGSLNSAGWHGWLGRDDMNDDDDDYCALTMGGETAASIGGRLQSVDSGMIIDLEDGFALPPPAVDLDEIIIAAPALDESVVAAPAHEGIPLAPPLAPPQGRPERFTLPAHVVKDIDELAFPAAAVAAAAQPLRGVRPSGCKAVRVGRRRVAVRSRREALPPPSRSKRRCQPCGSPL